MTLAQRRAELAAGIDAALPAAVQIHSYRPASPAPLQGWLQFDQLDTEDCTLGELRITVECAILVAGGRLEYEKQSDSLAPQLVAACESVGGRAVVVTPFTETVGSAVFYHLSAKFLTEGEA